MGISWNKIEMKVGTGLHHDQFKEGSMYVKMVYFTIEVVMIMLCISDTLMCKALSGIWCVEDNVGIDWHKEL
jgi:hypothetical protein